MIVLLVMNVNKAIRDYLAAARVKRLGLKAALIDMDGVLYDSMRNHTAAWHRMASELGIDCCREEFYLYEGMTGAATIDILFNRAYGHPATPDEARELYARKARYFAEQGEPLVMPGAGQMLATLRHSGIGRVLVTGSGQQSVLDRLDRDYPGIFLPGKRVTAHNVTHGKPHPEPYLRGMEMAGCTATECMVIENAPLGVQAGKAAGCFTVAVTTGPIPRERLVESGADLVYGSMPEFAGALPGLIEAMRSTTID